jgi:hypothetical protein
MFLFLIDRYLVHYLYLLRLTVTCVCRLAIITISTQHVHDALSVEIPLEMARKCSCKAELSGIPGMWLWSLLIHWIMNTTLWYWFECWFVQVRPWPHWERHSFKWRRFWEWSALCHDRHRGWVWPHEQCSTKWDAGMCSVVTHRNASNNCMCWCPVVN